MKKLFTLGVFALLILCFSAFAEDELIEAPIDQPGISESQVLQWAKNAALAPYNFNYENYEERIANAKQYFTPNAWQEVQTAINQSGDYEHIQNYKTSVKAHMNGHARIVKDGLLNKRYTWQIVVPINVNYSGRAITRGQRLNVNLLISRVKNGIKVIQFITTVRAIS